MRLEGKVALISGAAAGVRGELMGIGGAAAWRFVEEGAKVVLGDVNEKLGERTVAQLREAGNEALFLRLDVTSEEDWDAAVNETVSRYGRLDVLVNNAGIGSGGLRATRAEHESLETWEAHMAIHAKGTFLGTKRAVPELRRQGGGSIINISSIYGIVGSPSLAAYHAAKGAIRIFTKATAIQYAQDGIRANSVHPGFIRTPMTEASVSDPELLKEIVGQVPMGRVGQPEEIANGILFLASNEASYLTGAELVIDGGMTAQ